MPKLKDVVKRIAEARQQIIDFSDIKTLDNNEIVVKASYIFDNQIRKIAENIINNSGVHMVDAIRMMYPKDKFDLSAINDLFDLTKKQMQNNQVDKHLVTLFEQKYNLAKQRFDVSQKDEDSLYLLYYDTFGGYSKAEVRIIENALKAIAPNCLLLTCKDLSADEIKTDLLRSFEDTKQLLDLTDLTVCSDEDVIITPDEWGPEADNLVINDEIEKLKQLDEVKNDSKLIELLDKANKLVISANKDQIDFQNELAEKAGKGSGFEKKRMLLESFSPDERLNHDDIKVTYSLPLKTSTAEGRLDASKYYNFEYATLNTNTQNKIISIGNEMDENGLMANNPLEYESGTKDYQFRTFISVRDKLVEAIKNKDLNKIKSSAEKLVELDKMHSKIINEARTMNSNSSIDANISSSRNEFVPFKYRKDYIGTTRANGIYVAKHYARVYDLDFKELVKNPIKEYLNGAKELKQNGGIATFYKNHANELTTLLECMESPTLNDEFTKAMTKDISYYRGSMKVLDAFASCEDDADKRDKMYYINNGLDNYFTAQESDTVAAIAYNMPDHKHQVLLNLLAAKGDNLNPYVFSPFAGKTINIEEKKFNKSFDRLAAIKEIPAKDMLDGMFQIKDYDSDIFKKSDIKAALKQTAKDVLSSNVELTKNDEHIMKYFKRGKDIPQLFIENYNSEKLLSEVKQNGVASKEGLQALVESIAEKQNRYEETSLWNKIFHREHRDQRDIANKLMEELITKTNNPEAITEAVNMAKQGRTTEPRYQELMTNLQQGMTLSAVDNVQHIDLVNEFEDQIVNEDINKILEDVPEINKQEPVIDNKEIK